MAAVWIKLSRWYLNEAYTKDACQLFDVWAKQLSKVLSGKVYLRGTAQKKWKADAGPKEWLNKCKSHKSSTAVKEPEDDDDKDDNGDNPPLPPTKESRGTMKGQPN